MCEEVRELGSYIKGNMLHINEDISCYSIEIRKKYEKIFNNDENNL